MEMSNNLKYILIALGGILIGLLACKIYHEKKGLHHGEKK